MNNEHRALDIDRLEPPLEAAVKAALAEPIPADAIERVKTRARALASSTASPAPDAAPRHHRWKASRPIMAGLGAAAVLLAMAVGGLLFVHYSGGQAFARMVEKVKAASSVRFTTTARIGMGPETSGVMYLEGNRARFEQSDGMLIEVGDLDRKQGLLLDHNRKLAQPVDIDATQARELANPIDQLRRAKPTDAEPIGEELLKGRRTEVYRLQKVDLLGIKGNKEMLVWIDVERDLPAKIVIRDPDPKYPMEFRFDDFAWNEPLSPSLFSLAIPEGYQRGVVAELPSPKKPSPASPTPPENPNYPTDGVLSRDRVPARIVWGAEGKTITALMRDPESVPPTERREHELRQWDVATGKLRWSVAIAGANWLAASPASDRLAIVIGYEIQLRDAASGAVARTWATDKPLSPLAFSPDGKALAAGITQWGRYGGKGGKESGGVQFWDVERACLVRTIADDKPVTFVRYSVDGKQLATSSNDGPVKLWDVATGELARLFPARAPAAFSPDGQTIACASMAPRPDKTVGRVDLYNLRNGSLVQSFVSEKGMAASWLLSFAFSPNGRLLAASDWNGTVTLWDVATGDRKQTIADHQAGVLSVAFAPNGEMLATGSEDQTLRLRKLPASLTQRAPEKR